MKKTSKDTKEAIIVIIIVLLCSLMLIVYVFVGALYVKQENDRLQKELDNTPLLLEGTVISTNGIEEGGVVYVLWQVGATEYKIIEVDIFEEVIHTTIEVGDTVWFVVDRQLTDADLLAVIKEQNL